MPKYIVYSSETVLYATEVEADNEEQAHEDVASGNIIPDIATADATGFQIDKVVEVQNA